MMRFALYGQPVVWTHFPAGGYALTPAASGRLKRLGLRPGLPDLLIQWRPGKSLWIEMKTRGGVLSADQKLIHSLLQEIGFPVVVARSVDDVMEALVLYEVPMNRVSFGGKHGNTSAAHSGAQESSQSKGP